MERMPVNKKHSTRLRFSLKSEPKTWLMRRTTSTQACKSKKDFFGEAAKVAPSQAGNLFEGRLTDSQ